MYSVTSNSLLIATEWVDINKMLDKYHLVFSKKEIRPINIRRISPNSSWTLSGIFATFNLSTKIRWVSNSASEPKEI